jgi:hypothetical protein
MEKVVPGSLEVIRKVMNALIFKIGRELALPVPTGYLRHLKEQAVPVPYLFVPRGIAPAKNFDISEPDTVFNYNLL